MSFACSFLSFSGSLVNHFHQRQAARRSSLGRLSPITRFEDISDPLWLLSPATDLGQRAGDAPGKPAQEALSDQLQLADVPATRHACGPHLAHPPLGRFPRPPVPAPPFLPPHPFTRPHPPS